MRLIRQRTETRVNSARYQPPSVVITIGEPMTGGGWGAVEYTFTPAEAAVLRDQITDAIAGYGL